MTITHLAIQIVIAIVCAGIASMLVPRTIPGRFVGLIVLGLVGIWVGQWGFALLRERFGINFPFLYWQIEGVLIIPAIVGCAIVLYVITAILSWWHSASSS